MPGIDLNRASDLLANDEMDSVARLRRSRPSSTGVPGSAFRSRLEQEPPHQQGNHAPKRR